MYIPQRYKVTDQATIDEFIELNGFASLVTGGDSFPMATHIPIELGVNKEGQKILQGHLSKANPQWKVFAENPNVLVIFLSHLNHYISSSYYNFQDAPTWNYMSVQVTGTIKILEKEALWQSVRSLTDKYEKGMKKPVSLDALPADVLRQMDGIVGFEIVISNMEAVFKMSQNRDEVNFKNIIKEMKASGDPKAILTAEMMQKLRDGNL